MRLLTKLGVIGATVAGAAAFCLPTASAFMVQNHESITRAALPGDQVSPAALQQILVGPPPGGGAVGSDAFANDEFRHLDNSLNPGDICARAGQAWGLFAPIIQSGSVLAGGGLVDGPGARSAFGALLHAQQDFYAHSNWVEIDLAIGQPDRLAPPIFPTCDPAAFPPELHTGYYALGSDHDDPLGGCPPGGPPPPFVDCHSTLNKDTASKPNYGIAAAQATQASTDLFWAVRNWVASINGAEAAVQLFQAPGDTALAIPADVPGALADYATRGK
jgi:hypothetical protein